MKPDAPARRRRREDLVVVERGEHEDRRPVGLGSDPAGRLDAVDAFHPDVHDDHVGPVAPDGSGDLGAVRAFGDHIEPVLGSQDALKPGPDQRLVVNQYDFDHPARPLARG